MRINPEIQRNLWLEFSLHRLIAMPFALGLIFFAVSRMNEDNVDIYLLTTSATLFFLIIKIWGGYKAASSVIDEVNDRTWDLQKLSALSPWSLTIGKLFGSTMYTWYGAIIPLAIFSLSLGHVPWVDNFGWSIALLILSGLTVHAAALLASMMGVRANDDGRRRKPRPLGYLVYGLFVGGLFSSASSLSALTLLSTNKNLAKNHFTPPDITWYGMTFNDDAFMTFTSLVLVGWLIYGIYWQMRTQMKMKAGPWLWAGFLIFWGYFISGWGYPQNITPTSAALPKFLSGETVTQFNVLKAFGFSLLALYFILFQEPWTGVQYRRLVDAWKSGQYKKCFELSPRWIVTFAICLVFAGGAPVPMSADIIPPLTLLCFAARDIALLHFFKLSPNSRRPLAATLFYLLLLYALLPFVLSILHMKTAVFYFLPSIFYPSGTDISGILLGAALQAIIAIVMALGQWRRHWRIV